MGVELDLNIAAQHGTGHFHGLVDGLGSGGAGGIFEGKRVKGNAAVKDRLEAVSVELGV